MEDCGFLGVAIAILITTILVLASAINSDVKTQKEQSELKQEARIDIAEGYDVYVDGVKVDSDAMDYDFKTYRISIDDDKEIVHLEKKVASGDSYTPMPVPVPIVH